MTQLTSSERLLGYSLSIIVGLIIFIHTFPLMPALEDDRFKTVFFITIISLPITFMIQWLMVQIKK